MTKKQKLISELEAVISKTFIAEYFGGSLRFYKNGTETFIFSERAVDYTANGKDYISLTINDIKTRLGAK